MSTTTLAPDAEQVVHDIRNIDPHNLSQFGGKAAGLARMHRLGLPVPPAFVIDTEACRRFTADQDLSPSLQRDVDQALAGLERATGKRFGAKAGRAGEIPLLVSVRSGAQISMPGMMDTVLNLGLTSTSVISLAAATGDATFAVDTWARFWSMYADIVLDVDPVLFAEETAAERAAASADLTSQNAAAYEAAVIGALHGEGHDVSVDPRDQLTAAIQAVFGSWNSRRARLYREHHGISHDLGTAVTVQAMVFGNLGAPAGSGVAFTRDPKTGERLLFGEYLAGGQGEEVVAGTRTPVGLDRPTDDWRPLIAELTSFGNRLEGEYRDALDIEFTAESGVLYMLQVRPAKRTAAAAVHIAVDLLREGIIDPAQAVHRVTTEQVKRLVAPEFDEAALAGARSDGRVLTTGIPASPGHGSGKAVLDADRAGVLATGGTDVVLLRPTTSPQDLRGMLAATAVVTARGGATSHAAVVSRALDKPCVVGCDDLQIDPEEGTFTVGGRQYREGADISVDGVTGEVLLGIVPRSVPHRNTSSLAELLAGADALSGCDVWSRVTTAPDADRLGLKGLGILSLIDLYVGTGGVPDLLAAISAYSDAADAPAARVEEVIERITYRAVEPLLRYGSGHPVHLRVPTMTSPRARSWIHEWTALAPHLLIPVGPRRLLGAYAAGVSRAAADTGHRRVTLLIGGITTSAELLAFADLISGDSPVSAGAVLQNPAVLHRPERLIQSGLELWVDLAELVRTSCGRPEELLYGTADVDVNHDPQPPMTALPELVSTQLSGLVTAAAGVSSVGVDVAGHLDVPHIRTLYRLGVRRYTTTSGQAAELRLALGQLASERDHDG